MKKLSLLLGTLGGGLAGYLFSNKKLRDELGEAKDPEEAAKLLGKHLQKDGKRIGKDIKEFVDSEDVKENFSKARSFAKTKVDEAKKELNSAIDSGAKKAKKTTSKAASSTKKAVKKTAPKKKKPAARKKVQSKVRKVS